MPSQSIAIAKGQNAERNLQGRVVVVTGAGPRHRARARAGVRPAGRRGGGQRHRRGQRRFRAARAVRPRTSSTRSSRSAARPSPTATTSPPGTAPASWSRTAVDTFGRLDVLVNNAGFVRDRMLVSTSQQEWEDVVRVHLTGHFLTLRHAAGYWREQAKNGRAGRRAGDQHQLRRGPARQRRAGQLLRRPRPGILGLTLVAAAELGRYGVTVNAIAPSARTRMTEGLFDHLAKPESGFDAAAPENVAPLVVWLGSDAVPGRHGSGLRGRGRPDQRGHRLPARSRGRHRRPLGSGRCRAGGREAAGRDADAGAGVRSRLTGPVQRRRTRRGSAGDRTSKDTGR